MKNKPNDPFPPLQERQTACPDIACGDTALRFSDTQPGQFTLLQGNEPLLQGELSIAINDEQVDTGATCWRHRQHPNRLETWANLDSHNQLSLNIIYYLTDNALEIDYLARCNTPSRIAIRHQIRDHHHRQEEVKGGEQLPDAIADRISLSQYQRNDEPSQLLGKSGVLICKEAFSATLRINFNKKRDLDERR